MTLPPQTVATPGVGTRPRATLTRFVALALIWGMSFLFIKVGDEGFAPLQVSLGRVLCGAGTLLVILFARRERLPRDVRVWAHLAVMGVIGNVLPFTLFAYAEQRVPSALAGICNASTPLFTVAIVVLALPDERPTRRRIAGLLIGFLGVLVVLGAWQGFVAHSVAGALMALGAACCYGVGFAYLRRFLTGRVNSNVALSAGQLLTAAVELALVVPLLVGLPHQLPVRPVLAIAALGVLGTGLAYVLQYGLVRDAGATTASTVTYLIPVVATAAGLLLLHERLSWNQPAGAVIVLVGAALSQWRSRRAGTRTVSPVPDPGEASRHDPSPGRCTVPPRSGPPRR